MVITKNNQNRQSKISFIFLNSYSYERKSFDFYKVTIRDKNFNFYDHTNYGLFKP